MELAELKRKLKLDCDFDDVERKITVKIKYQCESIRSKNPNYHGRLDANYYKNLFESDGISVASRGCLQLDTNILFIHGQHEDRETTRTYFPEKSQYLKMKSFLQQFCTKREIRWNACK